MRKKGNKHKMPTGFCKSKCICALFFAKSYVPNNQSNIFQHNKDVGMSMCERVSAGTDEYLFVLV